MTLQFFFLHVNGTIPLLLPVLIWIPLFLCFIAALLFALNDGVKQLRRLHQIPCDRCLYNTGSPYLRCPVHPLAAFSEDAIYCRDFEPVQECFQPTPTVQAVCKQRPSLTR
jgi:hypothetical protein